MASNKYKTNIEQNGDSWTAQITRQVTSKKIHVSKQQDGFGSQAEALKWAESALNVFVSTQQVANQRQGDQRKESEEVKRQRSARRAEKTETTKLAAQAELAEDSSHEHIDND